MTLRHLTAFLTCSILIALSLPAPAAEPYPHLWSGFATPLEGRSPQQRRNAARAAEALNGAVILPGQVFSFNEGVGARNSDKGYEQAPMIETDGTLRDVPGGGICQLATTVYNTALLAGMKIVERHPHSRAVHYIPPGRDATIVSWRKDLKFSNPHNVPLQLKVGLSQDRLTASLRAQVEKPFTVGLRTDSVIVEPESAVARKVPGSKGQRGGKGFSVITRRLITRDGATSEEILSRDLYPPPSRLIVKDEP